MEGYPVNNIQKDQEYLQTTTIRNTSIRVINSVLLIRAPSIQFRMLPFVTASYRKLNWSRMLSTKNPNEERDMMTGDYLQKLEVVIRFTSEFASNKIIK